MLCMTTSGITSLLLTHLLDAIPFRHCTMYANERPPRCMIIEQSSGLCWMYLFSCWNCMDQPTVRILMSTCTNYIWSSSPESLYRRVVSSWRPCPHHPILLNIISGVSRNWQTWGAPIFLRPQMTHRPTGAYFGRNMVVFLRSWTQPARDTPPPSGSATDHLFRTYHTIQQWLENNEVNPTD